MSFKLLLGYITGTVLNFKSDLRRKLIGFLGFLTPVFLREKQSLKDGFLRL